MTRVIAIAGYGKSGKTVTIEKLIEELRNRGYTVGTIKHIGQEDFTFDQEGTDTWRHAGAGSEKVIALSQGEIATIEKKDKSIRDLLLEETDELDFMILEGFKTIKNIPKVMMVRKEDDVESLTDDFTVTTLKKADGELAPEEVTDLADLVEERAVMPVGSLDCAECGFDSCSDYVAAVAKGEAPGDLCKSVQGGVSMHVDGRRVPLKGFVREIVGEVVRGMTSALKDTKGHEIEIRVDKE